MSSRGVSNPLAHDSLLVERLEDYAVFGQSFFSYR
jgi:hypothetical protein